MFYHFQAFGSPFPDAATAGLFHGAALAVQQAAGMENRAAVAAAAAAHAGLNPFSIPPHSASQSIGVHNPAGGGGSNCGLRNSQSSGG